MAEAVFTDMVKKLNIEDKFEIYSAGTSNEEIGNGVHYGTVKKLNELSIPVVNHRAVQITIDDLNYYDYIFAMDEYNLYNLRKMFGEKSNKVKKLLSKKDIADPWYTDNFDETYKDIKEGLKDFIKYLGEKYENIFSE